MFGINDDDEQGKPAGVPSLDDAPVMPKPLTSGPAVDPHINPITGSQTLGTPQVSSGLPSIIPGSGSGPSIVKKKELLTPLPQPITDSSPPPEVVKKSSPLPSSPSMPPAMHSSVGDGELVEIKKEALHDLMPLVDKLDQPPEEKFKTLMMLLQASDNSDLVKDVYEAANKISDEKKRAQALLDVVNEINYFTQPHNPVEGPAKT